MKTLLISSRAATALVGGLTSASAAGCPAGQMRADARLTGDMIPVKVTDNELAFVALGGEIKGLDTRRLRMRRLVVQPGGVVPWHSHKDRPALIMTLSGQITEYRSTCAVGIDHKAGEVTPEEKGVSHWWKNNRVATARAFGFRVARGKSVLPEPSPV